MLVLFAAIVLIVDGLVGDRGFLAMLRARRQYDELSATLERQRAENARLRDEAGRLRNDPAAIEELARRELGLNLVRKNLLASTAATSVGSLSRRERDGVRG